jgi:hypothetical protein
MLVFPSVCLADSLLVTGGKLLVKQGTLSVKQGSAGSACATITDSDTSAHSGDGDFGYAASSTYFGTRFQAGSSYTLCSVDVSLKKTVGDGVPNWVLQAQIWSDNAGTTPLALLASSTNTKTVGDVAVGYGWINFTFAGVALTVGTNYWIAVYVSTLGDFGDFPSWEFGSNFTQYAFADATPTWASGGATTLLYRTYR